MPYIITTRPHPAVACDPEDPGYDMQHARRAVATFDEARNYVTQEIAKQQPDVRAWRNITRQGGTVGPLPDGTVIKVERVEWHAISRLRYPQNAVDRAAMIVAYNALEERAR